MEGFAVKGGVMEQGQWEGEDFQKQTAAYQIEQGTDLVLENEMWAKYKNFFQAK